MRVRVEQDGWWRRRGAGFVLALAVEALLLLALLTLAWPTRPPRFKGQAEKTFELANVDDDAAPATKSTSRVRPQARAAKRPAKAAKPTPPPPPAETPPPEPLGDIPGLIRLSREDLAAGDIGKIKRAPGPAPGQAAAEQLADAEGSGDSKPIGNAPNGEPLYAAEWFRRPRDAELSPYLAKARGAPGGWGLIACQTAPRYRVENCQILGESPAGSSLGYQVREAAWQFQVLPPRKGGKPMIGAWVRILIQLREG